MTDPILVACSHGTDNPAGQQAIADLCAAVRRERPGLRVVETCVDVQQPQLPEVLDALDPTAPAVVVPLLLSVGYHTRVDIARAVADRAKRAPTVASGPMGPDARLVGVLADRLATAGLAPDDGVVLAAAGSSDPRAAGDVETVAAGLRAQLPTPVVAGFGAAAQPTVADAVAGLRADGCPRVVIASYLLAPGYFHDRLGEAGADLVSAPLAPHPGLAGLVLDRYDTGRAALPT